MLCGRRGQDCDPRCRRCRHPVPRRQSALDATRRARPTVLRRAVRRCRRRCRLARRSPATPLIDHHDAAAMARGRSRTSPFMRGFPMDFTNAIPSTNGKPAGGIDAFDAAEAAPEYVPLPPGIYSARILRGEYTTTKAGADAYRIRFQVTEGP